LRRITLTAVAVLGAALMLTPAATAAGPKAHAAAFHFSGKTSQNGRFEMLLSGSGRRASLHFEYTVSCTSGLTFPDEETITVPAHPLAASGHHISRVKMSAEGSSSISTTTPSGQAVTGNLDIIVAGNIRVDTGNAKGRIEPTITLSNGDKCTSGNSPITWRASVD
jgi:hypothetical protein